MARNLSAFYNAARTEILRAEQGRQGEAHRNAGRRVLRPRRILEAGGPRSRRASLPAHCAHNSVHLLGASRRRDRLHEGLKCHERASGSGPRDSPKSARVAGERPQIPRSGGPTSRNARADFASAQARGPGGLGRRTSASWQAKAWRDELAAYAETLTQVRARLANFEIMLQIRRAQSANARTRIGAISSWADLAKHIG